MNRNAFYLIAVALLFTSLVSAQEPALQGQITAIKTLATEEGFTIQALNTETRRIYGVSLEQLSRGDAADLIRRFQSDNPPQPPVARVTRVAPPAEQTLPEIPDKPVLAANLEAGMAKRFHLVDGNILQGTIIKIEDDICEIETIDGILRVPTSAILEETATIVKKDDTRYVGPVLRDSPEEIVIRSSYGDVVISKRDIKEMDRYHGGRRVPWAEEKKTFFAGEAVLTDIFMDPTAFPLTPNTFYISGLSLGYGFTERFMIRSSFGSDFLGDLNVHPILRFYHRQTGTSEVAAAVGFHMFNHHPMESVVAKYAKYAINDTSGKTFAVVGGNASDIIHVDDKKNFYWEAYFVLSSRRSMPTGRGKVGWHVGFKTNSLILDMPTLNGYKWDEDNFKIPYRLWAAFEYDLSKRLKLEAEMWADNGHRFRTFAQALDDYIQDDTPFVFDSVSGDYRDVDFDFGFLYAVSESFRVGIHFQEPYLVFYWEFFEL